MRYFGKIAVAYRVLRCAPMRNGWLLLGLFASVGCGMELETEDVTATEQGLDERNGLYNNGLYNNGLYNNGLYNNGVFENPFAIEESSATWTKPWARVYTRTTGNGYSIAVTEEWGGNLATSSWTANGGRTRYVSGDGSGCAHPVTQTGAALGSSCDHLAWVVCGLDSYCCNTAWDAICVGEAMDHSDDGVSGLHATGVTGVGLPDNHSGCAAFVDAKQPSCRNSWDASCVDLAYHECLARYVTRLRVEDSRLMVDACVEPRATGTPYLPNVPASGPAPAREVCRRSLVLNGVYNHLEAPSTDEAERIQWRNWDWALNMAGAWVQLNVTVVPDPYAAPAIYLDGTGWYRLKGPEHHLWQLAGPAKPFYPDVINVANDATWANAPSYVDPNHRNVTLRPVLIEILSALTNTQPGEHHWVDLRYTQPVNGTWGDVADPGLLPPDHAFDSYPTELVWRWTSTFEAISPPRRTYVGFPVCKGTSMKRAMTGTPSCSGYGGYAGDDWTLRSIWNFQ